MSQSKFDHLGGQPQGLVVADALSQPHASRILANATLLAQY